MADKRILIIRPDRIGDVVLTTPLVRSLRLSFPSAFIAMMVHPTNTPLLEGNPHLDEVLTDDREVANAGMNGFRDRVRKIRSYHFNIGLMPFPRERHAWMMFLAGIRTRVGVGHKLYQMLTFTRYVSRKKYIPLRHEADYMLDLGLKIGAVRHGMNPELFLTNQEKERAREVLRSRGISFDKPVIGLNPISRNSSPNWSVVRYLQLTERLQGTCDVIINLGPHEVSERNQFAGVEAKGALVLAQSLREHMATVASLNLLVSASTGSMHIAAALGVPTLSLFCPLTACSPKLWGPIGNDSLVLLPKADYCQYRCPGDPKVCPLEDIEVSQVAASVLAYVKRSSGN